MLSKEEVFMFCIRSYVKKIVFVFGVIVAGSGLFASPAFAATPNLVAAQAQNLAPLEITPICSDGASTSAFWQVNNKNNVNVTINWTAIDNGHTGSYNAAAGLTDFASYYDAADGNNTMQFLSENETNPDTTNATAAACATIPVPPAPTCVDGTIQQNLNVSYTAKGSVTVQTVNDAPLCSDVSIDFSSYTMPAGYDGRGFYLTYDQNDPSKNVPDPTAFPQTIFDNASATLKAGTDGLTTLTVELPDSCNNTQTDVYYAPEQTTIGATGNGTANISSQINPSTNACETNPGNGGNPGGGTGNGGGTTTPPVTPPSNPNPPVHVGKGGGSGVTAVAKPVAHKSAAPAQLADTGQSTIAPVLAALSVMTLAVAVRFGIPRRSPVAAK